MGGTISEPASVMLNGGAYHGIDIIESMTGSSAMYPLSSCSGSIGSGFSLYNTTDVKDENDTVGNDNGTDWLHIVQYCGFTLSGLSVIVASVHRIRQSRKNKANAMEKVELKRRWTITVVMQKKLRLFVLIWMELRMILSPLDNKD